jgi:HlyD family secretion protein
LFVIANDLTKMVIDANVAEADVGGVEVNQNVTFTVDAFPNRTFTGVVEQVRNAPTNYQNVVAYDTVISVDNRDMKLKPGMTANVSIIIAEKKDGLKIQNAALRFHPPEVMAKDVKTNAPKEIATNGPGSPEGNTRGGGRHNHGDHGAAGGQPHAEHQPVRTVYVPADPTDPSKIKPVQVKVGISDGVYTEVVDGLKEGDQVITGLSFGTDDSAGSRPTNPFGGGRIRMR